MITTFWDLGGALTDAMGWDGISVYTFFFEEGSRDWWPDLDEETFVGLRQRLQTAFVADRLEVQSRFEFQYMLGEDRRDGWMHLVEFEGEVASESFETEGSGWGGLLRCIGGERTCPPEAVGWAAGYARLREDLRALEASYPEGEVDPDERELVLMRYRMVPEGFDPDAAFDPRSVAFRTFRGVDQFKRDEETERQEEEELRKAEERKQKRAAARVAKAVANGTEDKLRKADEQKRKRAANQAAATAKALAKAFDAIDAEIAEYRSVLKNARERGVCLRGESAESAESADNDARRAKDAEERVAARKAKAAAKAAAKDGMRTPDTS